MLKFTSLTINNFGPFAGEQTIDFTNEDGVTIIWGNNGRGKTTLLNIFRFALFDDFKDRRGNDVDLRSLANLEGVEGGNWDFSIVLNMLVDDTSYELTNQAKLRPGVKAPKSNDDYEQMSFLKENGSRLSGEQKDHILKSIMPEEVSKFFLFDGELLGEYEDLLKDDSSGGRKIKESIEDILGVPVLTNAAEDLESVFTEYDKRHRTILNKDKRMQQDIAALNTSQALLNQHKASKAELEEENKELQVEIDEITEKQNIDKRIIDALNQKEQYDKKIDEKKAEREKVISQIKEITKDGWKGLAAECADKVLAGVNERLKELEDRANANAIGAEILNEMQKAVDEHHCNICGQDVDESHTQKLKGRITAYAKRLNGLDADEEAERQSLYRRQAALSKINSNKTNIEMLDYLEKQLTDIEIDISDNTRKRDDLIADEIEGHGDVETLEKEKDAESQRLWDCKRELDNNKQGIKDEQAQIDKINSDISVQRQKINKATTDAEAKLAEKKMDLCNDIRNIFEESIDVYRKKLRGKVEKDATDLFLKISSDTDYIRLKINDNYGLEMVHKSGNIVPLRSAGFEHIVALSLIGALHKNAPLQGPIIMDSPFGRLDQIHKAKILDALPDMSKQVVLLVYVGEIPEQEARERLGTALKKEYRLVWESSFHTRIAPMRGER